MCASPCPIRVYVHASFLWPPTFLLGSYKICRTYSSSCVYSIGILFAEAFLRGKVVVASFDDGTCQSCGSRRNPWQHGWPPLVTASYVPWKLVYVSDVSSVAVEFRKWSIEVEKSLSFHRYLLWTITASSVDNDDVGGMFVLTKCTCYFLVFSLPLS